MSTDFFELTAYNNEHIIINRAYIVSLKTYEDTATIVLSDSTSITIAQNEISLIKSWLLNERN